MKFESDLPSNEFEKSLQGSPFTFIKSSHFRMEPAFVFPNMLISNDEVRVRRRWLVLEIMENFRDANVDKCEPW